MGAIRGERLRRSQLQRQILQRRPLHLVRQSRDRRFERVERLDEEALEGMSVARQLPHLDSHSKRTHGTYFLSREDKTPKFSEVVYTAAYCIH